MILQATSLKPGSRAGFWILLGLGLLLLPLMPTWGQTPRPAPARERSDPSITTTKAFGNSQESHSERNLVLPPTASAPEIQVRDPFAAGAEDHAQRLETARDEVELLEAQLMVQRAHLEAAKTAAGPANERLLRIQKLQKQGVVPTEQVDEATRELESVKAQVLIREAELQEAAVRLKQAQRRLANLNRRSPKPSADAASQANRQRLADLETKLRALQKEIEALRRKAAIGK